MEFMMLLGLDFDNTLICYDSLFHRVALDRGLIESDLPAQKNCIRDYLREQNQEDEWTHIQGEVYGARINEAESFSGVITTLEGLARSGIEMCIVSHKTRTPYRGPSYDLHQAAHSWLTNQGFFSPSGLNWQPTQVFFELTKTDKIQRIVNLGCSHYIDDLPEILEMLPSTVHPILFAPGGEVLIPEGWYQFHDWSQLPELLGRIS
jgi:hypothetical protein